MNPYFAALLVILACSIKMQADEPLWTDQQRLEQREMVCLGTVISVSKIGVSDKMTEVNLAIIEISGMKKGYKISRGSRVNVYYETSTSNQKRCPAYATLKSGDKGIFYLCNMTDPIKNTLRISAVKRGAFFLAMGSDVKKEPIEESDATNKLSNQSK